MGLGGFPNGEGGGGVSNVTASLPLVSSGGATPNLTWNANASGAARQLVLGPYTTSQTIDGTAMQGYDLVVIQVETAGAAGAVTLTIPDSTAVGNAVTIRVCNDAAGVDVLLDTTTHEPIIGFPTPVTGIQSTDSYRSISIFTDGSLGWISGG